MESTRTPVFTLGLLLAGLCLTSGCGLEKPAGGAGSVHTASSSELVLTLGVYQSDKASVMYAQFRPIATAIERWLGQSTGRPASVHLRIFKTYDDGIRGLVEEQVDFVRFGPASYISALEEEPGIQLLAMEHKGGEKRFQGVIVVPASSPIQHLSQLKQRSFAFGDEHSTIGRYLAQAELVRAGIRAKDLARFEYLDRHDKVVQAVMLGDFDAGAVKKNTLGQFESDGKVRVLHTFDNVTNPWIARANLDAKTVRHLREALLNLQDSEALASLQVDGFLPASHEDYALVMTGMRIAREFER